jgi:ParB-like nuclease domain
MQAKDYKTTDLIKALNNDNPRKISDRQKEALSASLSEFGCVEPVVVNLRTKQIVGGHQRVLEAAKLGIKVLPVVEIDVDNDREMAFNIALNKIKGNWDYAKLGEILAEVGESDFLVTGFDALEVSTIVDRYNSDIAELQSDEEGTLGGGVTASFANKTAEEVVAAANSVVKMQFGQFNAHCTPEAYEAWVEGLIAESTNGRSPAALGAVVAAKLGLGIVEPNEEEEEVSTDFADDSPEIEVEDFTQNNAAMGFDEDGSEEEEEI